MRNEGCGSDGGVWSEMQEAAGRSLRWNHPLCQGPDSSVRCEARNKMARLMSPPRFSPQTLAHTVLCFHHGLLPLLYWLSMEI